MSRIPPTPSPCPYRIPPNRTSIRADQGSGPSVSFPQGLGGLAGWAEAGSLRITVSAADAPAQPMPARVILQNLDTGLYERHFKNDLFEENARFGYNGWPQFTLQGVHQPAQSLTYELTGGTYRVTAGRGMSWISLCQAHLGDGTTNWAGQKAFILPHSNATFRCWMGAERPKSYLGHLAMINPSQNPWLVPDDPPYYEASEVVRRLGGVTYPVHADRLFPGETNALFKYNNFYKEFVLDALLGPSFDAFSVISNSEGGYNPRLLGWWYALLHQGGRVAAMGDSDFNFQDEAAGMAALGNWVSYIYLSNRTFNAENVALAVREGRTFSTTGPLLFFQIGGAKPGDVVNYAAIYRSEGVTTQVMASGVCYLKLYAWNSERPSSYSTWVASTPYEKNSGTLDLGNGYHAYLGAITIPAYATNCYQGPGLLFDMYVRVSGEYRSLRVQLTSGSVLRLECEYLTKSSTVTELRFQLDGPGGPCAITNNGMYVVAVSNLPPGAYSWQVQLMDSLGRVSTGAPRSFTVLAGHPDSDGDGLPDEWETAYFTNALAADPDADDDHDGFSNRAEYRAGTHPQVQSSRFEMKDQPVTTTNAPVTLRWSSGTDRVYRVQRADSLLGGFITVASNLTATPPWNTYSRQRRHRWRTLLPHRFAGRMSPNA